MLWHIGTDVPYNIHPGCMRDVMEVAIKAVELRQDEVNTGMCAERFRY